MKQLTLIELVNSMRTKKGSKWSPAEKVLIFKSAGVCLYHLPLTERKTENHCFTSMDKLCTSRVILLLVRAPWWLNPTVPTRPPSTTPKLPLLVSGSELLQTLHTVSYQVLSNNTPWHFSECSENVPVQLANWCVKQLSNLITQCSAALRSRYLLWMLCRKRLKPAPWCAWRRRQCAADLACMKWSTSGSLSKCMPSGFLLIYRFFAIFFFFTPTVRFGNTILSPTLEVVSQVHEQPFLFSRNTHN